MPALPNSWHNKKFQTGIINKNFSVHFDYEYSIKRIYE